MKTLTLSSIILAALVIIGCSTTPPTALESKLFNVTTNYYPELVTVTNTAYRTNTVIETVTTTNKVGVVVTVPFTNFITVPITQLSTQIVQIAGLFTMDDWTPITGAKDLAAVSSYWLSSTPGQLIAAMPAPPAIGQLVGVAISPRSMMIVTDDSQSIPAYGEIFIENNATPLVLTNQNQFYVITPGWTANHVSGFTADTANNRLICNTPNIYQLTGVIDFSGPSNQVFEFAIFVNGVQQGHITAHSQPRGAGQFICTTIIGLHVLATGDTVDIRADCDTAPGQSITVIHANLGATKLG